MILVHGKRKSVLILFISLKKKKLFCLPTNPIWIGLALNGEVGDKLFTVLHCNLTNGSRRHINHRTKLQDGQ